MYKILRVFVGVSILLLLIYFFDVKKIANEFQNIDFKWVYLVGLSIFASTLLGSVSMFLLVSRENEISFFHFLPAYWVSWSVGLVVPGQVGDVASISYLLKRLGFEWRVILARSLVDKVISLSIMLLLAVYALTFMAEIELYRKINLWMVLGLIVFSVFIFWKRAQLFELIKAEKFKIFSFFQKTLEEIVITVSNHPIRVCVNILLTTIKILLIGCAYWLMFIALGQNNISIWEVVPLVAASSLVAYLPISLNGIGTVEFAGILLFSFIDIPEATVLAAFILLRMIVLFLAWVPASFVLFFAREDTGNSFS